jgi:hypothetical protein
MRWKQVKFNVSDQTASWNFKKYANEHLGTLQTSITEDSFTATVITYMHMSTCMSYHWKLLLWIHDSENAKELNWRVTGFNSITDN